MAIRIGCIALIFVAGSTSAQSAEPWRLIQEAEKAQTVAPPAHVVPNAQAREGQCVMLSEGGAYVRSSLRDVSAMVGTKSGEVDFNVELPRAGRYWIWVRAQWHCVCSNSFYLLTTGTPQLPGTGAPAPAGDDPEPYRVKASAPPRAWRWMLAATCDFTAGPQKLRLIQAGHEALVDAIMLTSGPNDRPPGFDDQSRSRAFVLCDTDEEMKRVEDGPEPVKWDCSGVDAACALGSADWADFQLDVVVTPEEQHPAGAAAWGVEFARQPNGARYTLCFSRADNGSTNAQLCAIENNQRRVLASKDCGTLDARQPRWIRLTRLGESITAALDGTVRLTATDSAIASGTVALFAPQSEGFPFHGLQLRPLNNHLEHFQAGTADWRTHAGTWQTVKTGGNDDDPMACMAKAADNGGLLVAPWDLGEEYILNAQLKLVREGAAGFAFDIQDAQNYRAALLQWDKNGTVTLHFQQIKEGKPQRLQSQATSADPRQWHTLRLTRHSGFANVRLDGIDVAKCWVSGTTESTGVGLALTPASACLFGQVSGQTYTSPTNNIFLVEGHEAPITLCQWKTVDGVARIQGHPAVIFLSSERVGQHAALKLDRTASGDARLEVTFYKYSSDAPAAASSPLPSVPALTLPPLPDAPHIAIVFRRTENGQPVDYALRTDWETFRETTLQRNGETLQRAYSKKSSHPEGYKLFLQLEGNTLSGGIAGVSELHATLPTSQPNTEQTAIFIATQNFAPHDEAGIVEIRLCN